MPIYSNDPKEKTLKLRLNDNMRKHVEEKSRNKGCTMSEYIRELIKKDMKK